MLQWKIISDALRNWCSNETDAQWSKWCLGRKVAMLKRRKMAKWREHDRGECLELNQLCFLATFSPVRKSQNLEGSHHENSLAVKKGRGRGNQTEPGYRMGRIINIYKRHLKLTYQSWTNEFNLYCMSLESQFREEPSSLENDETREGGQRTYQPENKVPKTSISHFKSFYYSRWKKMQVPRELGNTVSYYYRIKHTTNQMRP